MIEINFTVQDDNKEALCLVIKRAAECTLSKFAVKNGRVSIAILNNKNMQSLNLFYRNIDNPTDVLSFANREGEEIADFSKGEYLGDIAISLDRAYEQANSFGHSIEREIAFLAVHGVLHLLGYDHINVDEEKEMFGYQEEILIDIGLKRD